jgi:hypothetical protein
MNLSAEIEDYYGTLTSLAASSTAAATKLVAFSLPYALSNFGTNNEYRNIVNRDVGMEITWGTPKTGVRHVNRFGIQIGDPTAGSEAPDWAMGLQIDLFDASTAGSEVWPFYYGDIRFADATKVFFHDISVGFIDNTAAAAQAGSTPYNIFNTDSRAQGDIFYIGHTEKFRKVIFHLRTLGVGMPIVQWQYWTGAGWANLTYNAADLLDSTERLSKSGAIEYNFSGTPWQTTTINGYTLYWIRGRLPSTEFSTAPQGSRIQLILDDGTPTVGISAGGHVLLRASSNPTKRPPVNSGWLYGFDYFGTSGDVRPLWRTWLDNTAYDLTKSYTIVNTSSEYWAVERDFVLASGTITIHLPSPVTPNSVVVVKNVGAGLVTVTRSGSDTIYTMAGGQTSFTIPPGEAYQMIYDSTNSRWAVF